MKTLVKSAQRIRPVMLLTFKEYGGSLCTEFCDYAITYSLPHEHQITNLLYLDVVAVRNLESKEAVKEQGLASYMCSYKISRRL
jgi:hypothetical protein